MTVTQMVSTSIISIFTGEIVGQYCSILYFLHYNDQMYNHAFYSFTISWAVSSTRSSPEFILSITVSPVCNTVSHIQ